MVRHKYPRTPHLPWSPGATADDKTLTDCGHFSTMNVVITEKMDGENTTLYRDYFHARSIDGRHHPSRDWVKSAHSTFAHEIPEGWRLCGENLYARHSIPYENLQGYFYLFSIWTDENKCLSWQETEAWAELLGLPMPRVLYRGAWNASVIEPLHTTLDLVHQEGFVVRNTEGFDYGDFGKNVAKWVRKNHVTTDDHWQHQSIIPNILSEMEK